MTTSLGMNSGIQRLESISINEYLTILVVACFLARIFLSSGGNTYKMSRDDIELCKQKKRQEWQNSKAAEIEATAYPLFGAVYTSTATGFFYSMDCKFQQPRME